jgi:hypothetical protein
MSIDAEIGKHISSQTLFVIAPAQPGKPSIRDVIVTKEIWEMVRDDATPPDAVSHVWGRARAKLDAIASGGVLLFGLDPFNKSIGSNVARTHPVSSGILDVRIRDPKPALRIFGGAAKKDAIVLVSFAYRDNLNFQKEVSRARGLWDMLFPKHSPMIGDGHDDYFSNLLPG